MGKVILVAGLALGDEGKGSSVDYLTRLHDARLVVRYNGGAQAGHRVITSNGTSHIFSQIGSGTFAGADTLLSRYMMVNPITYLNELQHLLSLGVRPHVYVEREALVTTPFHIATNRLRERARGQERHGSCGLGIGETMSDFVSGREFITIGDLDNDASICKFLARVQEQKRNDVLEGGWDPKDGTSSSEWDTLNRTDLDSIVNTFRLFRREVSFVDQECLTEYLGKTTVIFEGAQGVLLDQDFGFHPHTTWSDCTFGNAYKLLGANDHSNVLRLGVLRAYATRHGAGPFVSRDVTFNPCSAHDHNTFGEWQGDFRSGLFDFVTTRYALDVIGGVDGLIVTNLDRLPFIEREAKDTVPAVTHYHHSDDNVEEVITRLPVGNKGSISHQESLTRLLENSVEDTCMHLPLGDDYAWSVANLLNVRLVLTSHGPTANDKRIHGSW